MIYFASDIHLGAGSVEEAKRTERAFCRWLDMISEDATEIPLEEAACAIIVMKNGATIMLETSWALNTDTPIEEGSCRLCGSKAGLSIINNQLKINKIELDRQVNSSVELGAGGVAFYDGNGNEAPEVREARQWIDAVVNDTTDRKSTL